MISSNPSQFGTPSNKRLQGSKTSLKCWNSNGSTLKNKDLTGVGGNRVAPKINTFQETPKTGYWLFVQRLTLRHQRAQHGQVLVHIRPSLLDWPIVYCISVNKYDIYQIVTYEKISARCQRHILYTRSLASAYFGCGLAMFHNYPMYPELGRNSCMHHV